MIFLQSPDILIIDMMKYCHIHIYILQISFQNNFKVEKTNRIIIPSCIVELI